LGSKEGSQPGKKKRVGTGGKVKITIFYQVKVKIRVGRIRCETLRVLFLGTWN
jgi:hypothetical protein